MSTAWQRSEPAEPDNRPVAARAAAELARILSEARISKDVDPAAMAKACGMTTREVLEVLEGNVAGISDIQLDLISAYCGLTEHQALYATELGKVARRIPTAHPPPSLANRKTLAGAAKNPSPVSERGIRNVTLLTDTDLEIINRVDLANTLKRIMKRAGLGPAKVALKSGIARSQVYNLIDARRDALPRKPEQIRAFLEACRVAPPHIDALLRKWANLNRVRASYRRFAPSATPEPAPVSAPDDGPSGDKVAETPPQGKRTRVRFDTGQKTTSVGMLLQSELRNVTLVNLTWQDKLVTWCKPRVLFYRSKRGLWFLAPLSPLALPASWFTAKPEADLFNPASWKAMEWALIPASVFATVVFVVLAMVVRRQRVLYRKMLHAGATEPDRAKRSNAALARAIVKSRERGLRVKRRTPREYEL